MTEHTQLALQEKIEPILRKSGEDGISVDELAYKLEMKDDKGDLHRCLKRMTRSGHAVRLARDLYAAPAVVNDLVGKLAFRGGIYSVETSEGTYSISPENLGDAIGGDVVRIVPTGQANKGRERAVIAAIEQQVPRKVFAVARKLGRYLIAKAPAVEEPILLLDERARPGGLDILLTGRGARRRRARSGLPLQPLLAEVAPRERREDKDKAPASTARKDAAAGDDDGRPAKIEARDAYRYVKRGELNASHLLDQLARGMGVDVPFPPAAIAEVERAKDPADLRDGDVDLRDEPLVTIDDITAKDFDDAVCARFVDDGQIEILVAIADVSHYVVADSALDVEARRRGSSVYLPGRVYPMLPERLSNGLCSLVPNEDRYCSWVRMRINKAGELTWYDLGFGLMRSQARLTYNQVQEHIDGTPATDDDAVNSSLDALYQTYKRLHAHRKERGMLDLNLTEAVVTLSEDGETVTGVTTHPRLDAHRLIEECMLLTNETVADYLATQELPCIYRSHDEPDDAKIEAAWDFAEEFIDLPMRHEGHRTIEDVMLLVDALRDTPVERVASFVLLRAMQRAQYSVSTRGHFGIGARRYAHFTSPIRRYADLEVHRVLRLAQRGRTSAKGLIAKLKIRLKESATAANAGEMVADMSERYAERLMKARYMHDHVGEVSDAIVTGVVNFGLFVTTQDMGIEGLIHIGSLEDDHYVLEEAEHRLRGRRSGRVFRLGDQVRVQCVNVAVHDAQISFELYEHEELSASEDFEALSE